MFVYIVSPQSFYNVFKLNEQCSFNHLSRASFTIPKFQSNPYLLFVDNLQATTDKTVKIPVEKVSTGMENSK